MYREDAKRPDQVAGEMKMFNNKQVYTRKNRLTEVLMAPRFAWISVVLFSACVNLLILTGPIFMLQIYDRVLGGRSMETLVALSLIVAFFYLMMGFLDFARHEVVNVVATRAFARFDGEAMDLAFEQATLGSAEPARQVPSQLETLRRFLTSPTFFALIDLPWVLPFTVGMFLFHPLFGWLTIGGGCVLISIALLGQMMTRYSAAASTRAGMNCDTIANITVGHGTTIDLLRMRPALLGHWLTSRSEYLHNSQILQSFGNAFTAAKTSFRLFLQSAVLAIGAYLVLQGELTPAYMLACSIMMGRALAPLEQTLGGLSSLRAAHRAWQSLSRLSATSRPVTALAIGAGCEARLEVCNVTVMPLGATYPALKRVSFQLSPGEALGVLGTSGSGKSTLVRCLAGTWPAAAGSVRIGDMPIELLSQEERARLIAVMPQETVLFDATIAENIAGLGMTKESQIAAPARLAGLHDRVVELPKRYHTVIGEHGHRLSAGERQRLALARSLAGNPHIVILDEPDAHLDTQGIDALRVSIRALKAAGKIVIVTSHRPSATADCDRILVLENGLVSSIGSREELLRGQVKDGTVVAVTHRKGA